MQSATTEQIEEQGSSSDSESDRNELSFDKLASEPKTQAESVYEERSPTPESSNESFEIVNAPVMSDNDESLDENETVDDGIKIAESEVNIHNNQHGDPRDTPTSYKQETSRKRETILQCLFRLRRQKKLYNGASHMTATLMISNFVFFYVLQALRSSLNHAQDNQNRASHPRRHQYAAHNALTQILQSKMASSLLSSTVAGMINVLMTNPLWVASLRIMEGNVPQPNDQNRDKCPSLYSVIRDIARIEGIEQLWSGTLTSLLLVSNPIIQHFAYEQMRSRLLEVKRRQSNASLSPLQAFLFGAFAKALATVLTYPLQLAQVLLRLQTKTIADYCNNDNDGRVQYQKESERKYAGTIDCLLHQFNQGGFSALFVGMNAKLLQTVLTSAFTFLTYEQILVLVSRIYESVK